MPALIRSDLSSHRYRLSNSIWTQCRSPPDTAVQPVSMSTKRPRELEGSEVRRNLPGGPHFSGAPSQQQATGPSAASTSAPHASDRSTPVSEGCGGHAQRRQEEGDALGPAPAPPRRPSSALVLESPLGSDAQQAVAAALDPLSPYWPDHCYGEDSTPFFSYLYPLVSACLASLSVLLLCSSCFSIASQVLLTQS